VARDWQDLTPIREGASTLAGAASSFAGPAGAEAAKTLAALAQVKCTSVPQTTLRWWVTSIATMVDGEVYEGVAWTLSETLLEQLGGRVTGSVVVSVIPAFLQGAENDRSPERRVREGRIRARATLYREGNGSPRGLVGLRASSGAARQSALVASLAPSDPSWYSTGNQRVTLLALARLTGSTLKARREQGAFP
jgi:hypothetical protein